MTIREEVGARIRERREAAGLSQGDLAAVLHRTRQSVSAIERGVQSITTEQLALIARSINTTVDYLLDGDEGNPYDTAIAEIALTCSAERIIEYAMRLMEAARNKTS